MLKNTPNKTENVAKIPPLDGREAVGSIIYLIGYMASGKSTFGKKLANALHYNFVDLDDLMVKEDGITIVEIFNTKGEDYFRNLEKEILHQTINLKNTVISCGGGTPCFFDNIDFINKNGRSIWLNPPVGFIVSRLKNAPNTRPILNGLSDEELKLKIETQLEERKAFYSKATLIYNTSEKKENDFINLVKEVIFLTPQKHSQ
jgi:shikimate kinase